MSKLRLASKKGSIPPKVKRMYKKIRNKKLRQLSIDKHANNKESRDMVRQYW